MRLSITEADQMILLQLDGFCISCSKQHHKDSIHKKEEADVVLRNKEAPSAQYSGLITLRDQYQTFSSVIFYQYKWFIKPELKINFRKYWIHECGMDATRFPSLRCILKQCFRTGSGCRVWETKGFSCGLKIYFEILILTFQK